MAIMITVLQKLIFISNNQVEITNTIKLKHFYMIILSYHVIIGEIHQYFDSFCSGGMSNINIRQL